MQYGLVCGPPTQPLRCEEVKRPPQARAASSPAELGSDAAAVWENGSQRRGGNMAQVDRIAGLPQTRYARSGTVNIAYQVVGDRSRDLVFVPGWVSHVEAGWDEPLLARFRRRLASFSRLILFDKRGTGMSDRGPGANLPTPEEGRDGVRAGRGAAGSGR